MKEIARTKLPKVEFISEGSWGQRGVGAHESEMILYAGEHDSLMIEWDIPTLDEVEHIGLEMEGKRVVGYDGVMSFPRPAYKWLRSLGYSIAKDVI